MNTQRDIYFSIQSNTCKYIREHIETVTLCTIMDMIHKSCADNHLSYEDETNITQTALGVYIVQCETHQVIPKTGLR